MSKTLMWIEDEADGVTAECLFNEDSRTYEVTVCTGLPCLSRSESFPAHAEPVWGMGDEDRDLSLRVAERLVADVSGSRVIGVFA